MIWLKLLTNRFVLVALLTTLLGSVIAVQHLNATRQAKVIVTLREDLKGATEANKALQEQFNAINTALNQNAANTKVIIQRGETIKETIRELPHDETPISDPVRAALNGLPNITKDSSK